LRLVNKFAVTIIALIYVGCA